MSGDGSLATTHSSLVQGRLRLSFQESVSNYEWIAVPIGFCRREWKSVLRNGFAILNAIPSYFVVVTRHERGFRDNLWFWSFLLATVGSSLLCFIWACMAQGGESRFILKAFLFSVLLVKVLRESDPIFEFIHHAIPGLILGGSFFASLRLNISLSDIL